MRISDIELYHYPATRNSRVKWLLRDRLRPRFVRSQCRLAQRRKRYARLPSGL
jgi:hypothetical protein